MSSASERMAVRQLKSTAALSCCPRCLCLFLSMPHGSVASVAIICQHPIPPSHCAINISSHDSLQQACQQGPRCMARLSPLSLSVWCSAAPRLPVYCNCRLFLTLHCLRSSQRSWMPFSTTAEMWVHFAGAIGLSSRSLVYWHHRECDQWSAQPVIFSCSCECELLIE